MGAEAKALEQGLEFTDNAERAYLNMAARTGKLIITSGHTSTQKGKLGLDVTVEQGYEAAKEVATNILQAVHQEVGTLDGLRVVKLLGCVNSTLDFIEQHLVINGASDLLHEIFEGDDGHHARSAIGFAQLPTGVAVEIEAIFEIKGCARQLRNSRLRAACPRTARRAPAAELSHFNLSRPAAGVCRKERHGVGGQQASGSMTPHRWSLRLL